MSTGLKANSDGSAAIQVGGSDAITLTSGGVAGFVSNPTLTAGTANGVAYANGSKVLTTGSGLVFDGTNLGVGTSSPSFSIDISQASPRIRQTATTGTNSSLVQLANTGGTAYVGLDNSSGGLSTAYSLNLFHGGAYPIVFSTNNTERARITSGGYFKASDNGTYLGSTGTYHEINQTANDNVLFIRSTSTAYSVDGVQLRFNRNTTNNTFYALSYYNDAATAYKFRVADSGTVTNTTGTYTTISDIKLKQDVVDASSQWNDIKALRIVKYRLKEYVQNDPDSKPFLGLIAQEVEQVCPGLVEEQEDVILDEDGKLIKNGEVTKGVKTSILYMKAVKALQEAMTRIEALEAEVQALKGQA